MNDKPMTIFSLAQRGMSAQLVRMNAAASNLAAAGSVARSEGEAYRPLRAVFAQELDQQTGVSSVRVSQMQREQTPATSRHEPGHPLADGIAIATLNGHDRAGFKGRVSQRHRHCRPDA